MPLFSHSLPWQRKAPPGVGKVGLLHSSSHGCAINRLLERWTSRRFFVLANLPYLEGMFPLLLSVFPAFSLNGSSSSSWLWAGEGGVETEVGVALLPRVCSSPALRRILAALCPSGTDYSGQLLDPVCNQHPSFISFKVLLEFQSLRILELEASGP